MLFDQHGLLAAGIHDYDMPTVKGDFVDAFPHSTTRPSIYAGLTSHRSALRALVNDFEQILDGSFVTNKNDPADVDCFVSVDARRLNSLPLATQQAFQKLVAGKVTQAAYRVDAYFCPTTDASDPNFERYRTMRKYWLGEFGFDRQEHPKGLVRVIGP